MKPEVTIIEIHEALAKINDISLATVKRRSVRENWTGREAQGKGRGGMVKLFLSSMLPSDIQVALKAAFLPAVRKKALPSLEARKQLNSCRAQEEKAFAKTELAKAYGSRMEGAGHGQKEKVKRLFFDNYNIGKAGLFPEIFKHVGRVDVNGRTVSGWVTKLKKNGWEPTCLIDNRGYCGRGLRSVTPEQMEIILAQVKSIYNRAGKPVIEIIHQSMEVMIQRGIEPLSDSTYYRWLKKDWIPYHNDEWIWWREGDKGLNDKVAYYLERDYDKIEPGDLLVADGHVLNFEIINPFTGKPKRMMLVLFYDAKSNYPLGWDIMPTENTEVISSALRRAILRLGKIPTAVYIDNGRAFKGKYFINKDLNAEFKGLYERIGIKYIIAKAYHGQSKVIERFFKVFGELERLAPSFVGECIDNKPAHLNRGEKLHMQLHKKVTRGVVPTLEVANRAIAIWFDRYVNKPQSPNSHLAGQSPADVMKVGDGVDPVALRCLMMKSEKRKIRRRGVNIFGINNWYYSPELYGRKHDVVVRYDLQHRDSVLVYDISHGDGYEEFVCEAFLMGKVHPMVSILGTDEDKAEYTRQIEMKNGLRKMTISSAREIVETQVIPETRKRIEQAGFCIEDHQIKPVKALPEPELTEVEKEKIKKEVEELEFESDETIEAEFTEDYTPEVINEADQAYSELKEMSESDRFEKLVELEVRNWLIPKEHKAWMKYFEQTNEYERHQDYFEDYRTKMAMMYGTESTDVAN